MAALPPPIVGPVSSYGRVIEIVVTFVLATSNSVGKTIVNVWHFWCNINAGGALPVKGNVLAGFDSSFSGFNGFLAADSSVPVTYRGRWLDDFNDGYLDILGSTSFSGSHGDRLPAFNSAVMQMHTGVRGKSWRGSKHFCPIAEADTSKDQLINPLLASLAAYAAAVPAGFTDSDGNHWQPIIVSSKFSTLNQNPTNIAYAPVTTCDVNLKLGTMRHRKEKD